MTERPILFSGAMVRALLSGAKTQTRRILKVPHESPLGKWEVLPWGGPNGGRTRDGKTVPYQNVIGHTRTGEIIACPYGQPGDRLWVREAHYLTDNGDEEYAVFAADSDAVREHLESLDRLPPDFPADVKDRHRKLRPSIHMPRWASRITLEITSVRVERLRDISEADARAEGTTPIPDLCDHVRLACADIGCSGPQPYRTGFRSLWQDINGPGSWDANPWVWTVEFRKVIP